MLPKQGDMALRQKMLTRMTVGAAFRNEMSDRKEFIIRICGNVRTLIAFDKFLLKTQ